MEMKIHTIKHALIVDDSATMRMLISMSIRKIMDSIRITEAESGLTAPAQMKQQDFDLVYRYADAGNGRWRVNPAHTRARE